MRRSETGTIDGIVLLIRCYGKSQSVQTVHPHDFIFQCTIVYKIQQVDLLYPSTVLCFSRFAVSLRCHLLVAANTLRLLCSFYSHMLAMTGHETEVTLLHSIITAAVTAVATVAICVPMLTAESTTHWHLRLCPGHLPFSCSNPLLKLCPRSPAGAFLRSCSMPYIVYCAPADA